MAKTKTSRRSKPELDSVYVLKIVLFFVLGAIWLSVQDIEFLPGLSSLPIGLGIGLVFARHDHFRIDRKIEYVVLLGAAFLSYVASVGMVLQF